MPLKSVDDKNCCFNEQKCIFGYCGKVKTLTISYNFIINVCKMCSVYLFRTALSELMSVLHKDVLFHGQTLANRTKPGLIFQL